MDSSYIGKQGGQLRPKGSLHPSLENSPVWSDIGSGRSRKTFMDIGDRIHCGHSHLRMEEVECHPATEMSEGPDQ